jgi:hypothetical protein
MNSPSGLHSLLSIAATHLDGVYGRSPGRSAICHRLEAIRLVNQQLSDPILGLSEETIITVCSLMSMEVTHMLMRWEVSQMLISTLCNRDSGAAQLPLKHMPKD